LNKNIKISPPVNKSIKKLASKSNNKKIPSKNSSSKNTEDVFTEGISVITCTNRPLNMNNVFENFCNQEYEKKELVIILNDNKMNIKEWVNKAKKINESIKIIQIDESYSLGYCLNQGINEATYDIIAKFDDDDYYGSKYLSETVKAFKYADVIGKSTTYVYFEASKTLAIRNPKKDNRYVYRIEGPTLLFKKKVFDTVKFADKSLGEDIQFCKDCTKNGYKIYSCDIHNYIYVRHGQKDKHAWNITDDLYIKLCKIIGKTDNYKSFVDKSIQKD